MFNPLSIKLQKQGGNVLLCMLYLNLNVESILFVHCSTFRSMLKPYNQSILLCMNAEGDCFFQVSES